ncbi:MAG: stage V sporulation protein AD [Oscillospiraceae bacterium]|jgi:stage V sporulation protein AD|nr:stage V sporulation protein AD [Oscillospiraceae bacterium]
MKKLSGGSIWFETPLSVSAFASAAGPKENDGPLSGKFDFAAEEPCIGEDSWEKSESSLITKTFGKAIEKARLAPSEVDFVFAGDLLNQCVGTVFGLRDFKVPFIGVYGACSTMAESLALASVFISSGLGQNAAAITSSHFCSAERQFRMPVNYGGQRTPTSQWTATAAGCAVVSPKAQPPYITGATFGTITDMGVKDSANMGAAMAGAAYETITAHLSAHGTHPRDYDLILTGDLGVVGSGILRDLLHKDGVDISNVHNDCGLLLYDLERQDVHAGGSGAGCSAAVLCADILPKLQCGELHRVLFVATGALMSAMTAQQGESIPGIAHAIEFTSKVTN